MEQAKLLECRHCRSSKLKSVLILQRMQCKNLVKWAVDMWIKNVDNRCGQTGPNARSDYFGDFFVHFVQCVCLNPQREERDVWKKV